jgi:hypothetical protein
MLPDGRIYGQLTKKRTSKKIFIGAKLQKNWPKVAEKRLEKTECIVVVLYLIFDMKWVKNLL